MEVVHQEASSKNFRVVIVTASLLKKNGKVRQLSIVYNSFSYPNTKTRIYSGIESLQSVTKQPLIKQEI